MKRLMQIVLAAVLGVAVGEALRNSLAIAASSRCGLSAHTATKAPAVDRLMPA